MYPASFWFNEPSTAYICLIVINLFTGITCIVSSFLLEIFSYDKVSTKTAELPADTVASSSSSSSSIPYPLGSLGHHRWLRNQFSPFSLFSTALWDLPNSRPIHSLLLSSHLFLCLPCLLPRRLLPSRALSLKELSRKEQQTKGVSSARQILQA